MRNILICLISLIFCLPVQGQLNKKRIKKKAQEMVERKLLVILDTVRTDLKSVQILQKGDSEKMEIYQKAIERYNKQIKLMVQKYWKLHPQENIDYVRWKKMKNLAKTKETKYAVLAGGGFYVRPALNSKDMRNNSYYLNHNNFYDYSIEVKKGKIDTIYEASFALSLDFSEAISEMTFLKKTYRSKPIFVERKETIGNPSFNNLLQLMTSFNISYQQNVNAWKLKDIVEATKTTQHRLKEKILLINEKQIKEKELSISEIKESYPYALEIVDDETFNNYIASENSKNYAFLIILKIYSNSFWSQSSGLFHLIVDGENADMLAISPTSSLKAIYNSAYINLNKLKEYTQFIKK